MENAIISQELNYGSNYLSGMVVAALLTGTVAGVNPIDNQLSILVCLPLNATTEVRYGIEHKSDTPQYEHQPRTALGERLMALRRAYIERGGKFLDENEFETELRARRGGVNG